MAHFSRNCLSRALLPISFLSDVRVLVQRGKPQVFEPLPLILPIALSALPFHDRLKNKPRFCERATPYSKHCFSSDIWNQPCKLIHSSANLQGLQLVGFRPFLRRMAVQTSEDMASRLGKLPRSPNFLSLQPRVKLKLPKRKIDGVGANHGSYCGNSRRYRTESCPEHFTGNVHRRPFPTNDSST